MSVEGYERTLLAAQGYGELSMFDDALAELDGLPVEIQEQPTAVEMRLSILMQARRWKRALAVARRLIAVVPEKPLGYIHTAFCLHEMGDTEKAREILLNGPEVLHIEPTYHYNLACYECRLGNFGVARAHLDRSFELDKKFRDFAKSDPDLQPLRSEPTA